MNRHTGKGADTHTPAQTHQRARHFLLVGKSTAEAEVAKPRIKSERGDERKRGLPYCPRSLGPGIDQKKGGEGKLRGGGNERAPRARGPTLWWPQLSSGPSGDTSKGSRPSIRPISTHANTRINACTHIPLALALFDDIISLFFSYCLTS